MKLSLNVLILIISFAIIANAQSKFGLKAGINIGKFNIDNSEWESGYSVGGFTELNILNNFDLSFGLNFTKRGGTLKNISSRLEDLRRDTDVHEYDLRIMGSYLELPLTVKYKIDINKDICIAPVFGFSYSFLLSIKSKGTLKNYLYFYTGADNDPNRAHYISIPYISNEELKDTNNLLSTVVGVEIGFSQIIIQLSYCYDLNTIESYKYTTGFNDNLIYISLKFSYVIN